MSNFKVGDKVNRVVSPLPFKILEGGGPYTVTAVSPSAHFIQINLNTHYGDHYPWDARNFKLVEQDDPLPPAPESVSYLKDEGQRKLTASMYPQSVSIKIHLEYPGTVKCLGYSMEPDAALQLAHDLRRMAMEIKRKEKQNA